MPREPHEVSDATFRLLIAPGVGATTIKRLRGHFESDERVVAATARELGAVEGVGPTTAMALRRAVDGADPQRQRTAMAERGARLVLLGDEDYPVLLAAIPDPPAALWVRGRLETADRLALAVVGSRRCTAYGREQAARLSAILAECGLTIVSGGAVGIDAEAHRAALRVGERTIAVMGCGLARSYPPQHGELFERIVTEGGALVSAYPMHTEARPGHFPHRNRIISGLAVGVLVIEAARRSGALITARRAAEEQGREAMALPGRVDSPASAGCLDAIRDGWAGLVTTHADVLAQLDAASQLVRGALEQAGHTGASNRASLFDGNLTGRQRAIVEVLREAGEAVVVDQVATRTGLPMGQVLAELTLLEIRGCVRRRDDGFRIRSPEGSTER